MKKKVLTVLVVMMAMITINASAVGVVTNAKIYQLGYDKDRPDVLFIRTDVTPSQQSDKISCHVNPGWNYVLRLQSSFEEKMYSALLAAHASKQTITLRGSGSCDIFGTIESLHVVYTY